MKRRLPGLQPILQRYQQMQAPAKASLWFLVCGFLQKGIGFLTTPIFTRVMSEAQYGAFSVYTSWLSIVQIIVSLNLAAGVYTRGLVKNEEDQDRFSSSMLGLSTTCMAVCWVIYALFHKQLNSLTGLSTAIMAAMFLEIWGTAAYQFWSNRERVAFRYRKLVALTLAYTLLRPILGVVFVVLSPEERQMAARVAATVLVNFFLFAFLYFSITKKGKCFFHREYWLYGLRFNLPLLPHYLSQIVLNQSDRLMISSYCGSEMAGYYSVAYTLAMVLQILSTSISSTMNPWIYKTLKKGEPAKIGKVSYGILLLIAASNVLVAAAAPELLTILAPDNYQAALWVIPPVTASVYFMFLYNLFATFEYYYEKTRYVMIASVCGAVLNVVLNAICIPRFGFLAAGYTTLVCYIVYALAHYLFMQLVCKKQLEGEKVYSGWLIVAIGGGLVACVGGMMLLYGQSWMVRYGIILAMLVVAFFLRKRILGLIHFKKS